MRLTAAVTKAELTKLVASLTPLELPLGNAPVLGAAVLTLDPPTEVSLVAGSDGGLRLVGAGKVATDSADFTIRAWQLLLAPRTVTRGGTKTIEFLPILESINLEFVPGFADHIIAAVIRTQISDGLVWDFAQHFVTRFPLSIPGGPTSALSTAATSADVKVTTKEIQLTIQLKVSIASTGGKRKKR